MVKIQRRFLRDEVADKRVVLSFDLKSDTDTIYFNYVWAPPLNLQKFFLVDSRGMVVEADEVRSTMLLARVKLLQGHFIDPN